MRRVIGALACVLLLSGCVGIPTSGNVVTGDIINDRGDPDVDFFPEGPQPGATQEEILTGFIAALRGTQSQFAVARQFLSNSMADTWNPDESVIIRTGIDAKAAGPTENSMLYTITSSATVDSNGRYVERSPASLTLTYGFVQEDGEWRISEAPDGIVLTQASFGEVFSERALYFFDPTYRYLVPDVRWFPARSTIPYRTVRELLDGPADWLQQGVVLSAFPVSTTVASATVASGTATVELSSEALLAEPAERERMRQQLAASLDVANVVMTVGGLEVLTPDSGEPAERNPSVEGPALVGTPEGFGFDTGGGPTGLGELGTQVTASGATAATLSRDKQTVAFLTPDGVMIARQGAAQPTLIDPRPGLIPPSLDLFRFVWSAQGDSASSLRVFELDGTVHTLTAALPDGARIVSVEVSRDGTRVLLYLSTSAGPQLGVAGIIRQQGTNIPTELGELQWLPGSASTPVDATWVSDRVVATVSHGGEASPITLVEIGGPSRPLSQVLDATAIAGGNAGEDGLRVLGPDGAVWQPRGTGGWVETGISASFLGTKQ